MASTERRHTHHNLMTSTKSRSSEPSRFLSTSSVGSSSISSEHGKPCWGDAETDDDIFKESPEEKVDTEYGKRDDRKRPSFQSLQSEDLRRPSVTAYQMEDQDHPDVKSIQKLVSNLNFTDP